MTDFRRLQRIKTCGKTALVVLISLINRFDLKLARSAELEPDRPSLVSAITRSALAQEAWHSRSA
jgi:hypothetical protein